MSESESEPDDTDVSATKRGIMQAGAGVLSVSALATIFADNASAQSAAGVVGADAPYELAYINRRVWIGRTSDPSSPADGEEWYRSDL